MSRTTTRDDTFLAHKVRLLPVAFAAVLAAGCAAKTNPTLEKARAAYQEASTDEFVAKNVPVSLHEAQVALQTAEKSFEDGDRKEVDALAYVALRRVEITERLTTAR